MTGHLKKSFRFVHTKKIIKWFILISDPETLLCNACWSWCNGWTSCQSYTRKQTRKYNNIIHIGSWWSSYGTSIRFLNYYSPMYIQMYKQFSFQNEPIKVSITKRVCMKAAFEFPWLFQDGFSEFQSFLRWKMGG